MGHTGFWQKLIQNAFGDVCITASSCPALAHSAIRSGSTHRRHALMAGDPPGGIGRHREKGGVPPNGIITVLRAGRLPPPCLFLGWEGCASTLDLLVGAGATAA